MILRIYILTLLLLLKFFSLAQTNKADSLFKLIKNTEDTGQVNILVALAREFRYSDVDTARYFADKALTIANKLKYEMGIADSKRVLCALHASMGKFNEGVKYGEEALAIYNKMLSVASISEKQNLLPRIASAYMVIGHNRLSQGNLQEALRNSLLCLKIREQLGDKKGVSDVTYNIGNIYANQKNYSEALKYYYASLKISEELGIKTDIAWMYNTLGFVCIQQGNYDEALKHCLAALKLAKEANDKPILAEIYHSLGAINAKKEKYSESLKYYLAALKGYEETGIREQIPWVYNNIGSVYLKQKKHTTAALYLDKALKYSKEFGKKEATVLIYGSLAALDSARNNFKKAFEYYKQHITYRDSLINEENTKKTMQQQMQYEFDKKEDSLHQKQIITQSRLQTQQKQKKFYLGGSILLALLSLFVFLNFRNQKRINRLMDDAHAKEKAELELQSLRAQLNPHFMFNSLNAIQELILKEENEKSQSYLARFAKLLRMLLENADKPFIPLQREIGFLQLYLSLENLRIPDLQFSINVDSSIDTEKTMIPNMILQPYIENAIWHGLSHKENDRQLWIRICRANGTTIYEIEDNGVGRKKAAELKSLYRREHKSKGMELLSKRFKLLAKEYGSDIETKITDLIEQRVDNGTLVSIRVPQILK